MIQPIICFVFSPLCYYCDNLLSKQHKPKHVSVHSGSLSCHRYKSSSHSGHEFGRDQYSMSSKQPIKKWWSFWTKLIISHCGLALTLHRGNLFEHHSRSGFCTVRVEHIYSSKHDNFFCLTCEHKYVFHFTWHKPFTVLPDVSYLAQV